MHIWVFVRLKLQKHIENKEENTKKKRNKQKTQQQLTINGTFVVSKTFNLVYFLFMLVSVECNFSTHIPRNRVNERTMKILQFTGSMNEIK